ncbi:RHS repeat domain-containing protein [Flagellimonas sp. 2504JD1-5]
MKTSFLITVALLTSLVAIGQNDWNTVQTTTYDAAGTRTSKTKVFHDDLGRLVQSQALDTETNKVWASEIKYDAQGRPVIQTLSSPINSNGVMNHKTNFMLKTNGSEYSVSDFESNPSNPAVVGSQTNSLGWYYSDSNSSEAYQDITEHPFSATEYSTLNPGVPLRLIGGNQINGQWPQAYSFTMRASQELAKSVAFGETQYENHKILKTVVRDVHGNENAVFVDSDGRTLAAARSGGTASRSMSIDIGEQGFVDIHVPQGSNMGFTVTANGHTVTTHNLITEGTVTPSTSLSNGFYRVSVSNPDNYDPANPVTVNYNENYYDYSLNEYDETGRLTAVYQPKGDSKATKPKTSYEYNTLGQLIKIVSPDEGTSEFKYRDDGQIRYSQNSVQKDAGRFSYTNYDQFGRPVESGEVQNSGFASANPDGSMVSGTRTEVQHTEYDETAQTYSLGSRQSSYPSLGFSAGNVAYTANDYSETWYSYDIYSRIEWVVQEIQGLGTKTIDYEYDPIRGLVTEVIYQKGVTSEQFYHRYSYNTKDQLTQVETSTNGTNYRVQAVYEYYETGALKRTELAGNVQGIDYVYNLVGQLKSINHPSLSGSDDPSGDTNDLFGMQIDYHKNDYARKTNSNITTPAYGVDQLNGNIKGVRWNNPLYDVAGKQSTYAFTYDRNNWLTGADYGQVNNGPEPADDDPEDNNVYLSGSNTLVEGGNSVTLKENFHAQSGSTFTARIAGTLNEVGNGDYDVTGITYDPNGNIQSLKRNKDASGGNAMDDLTYSYKTTPQDGPNQLLRVDDDTYNDTGDAGVGDIVDQDGNNYVYNKIGQLTENVEEKVKYYYNASGLVTEVRKDNAPIVKFYYNDRNHRVRKETFSGGMAVSNTYYIRDVSGKVMAIYSGSTLQQQPMYGNQRFAVYDRPGDATTYQLTDHLGNVRAIFQKSGSSTSNEGYNDYYPFGMLMPQRNSIDANNYRYAFQGQEKDPETGKEAFELRLWDARIGRWLTTDPAGQYSSPYLGMGNNPIGLTDVDGGFAAPPTDFINKETGEHVYVNDGIEQIVLVEDNDWFKVADYDLFGQGSFNSFFGNYTPVLPNEFNMFQFPESGKGFARYTTASGANNGNNENYYVNGVRHTTDNWASKETFIKLYRTFVDFNDKTGMSMHYGDISAYDPSINLGHSTHFTGDSVDLHYIDYHTPGLDYYGYIELRGNHAYFGASISLTNQFFTIAQKHGFTSNYSYGDRFTHIGNNNHNLHRNHLHIGR